MVGRTTDGFPPVDSGAAVGNGSVAPAVDEGKGGPASSTHYSAPMAWRLRDIDLRFVLKSQLWATALVTLIPVIMLGIIHWAIDPRVRPYYIYDGTISYPTRGDTIPAWAAIVVPFILMIISLLVGEFILFKKVHRNITMAVSTALHFFIDMVVAFLFTIFMTELTKVATGRLRPDFLAKCNPQNLPANFVPQIGASANTVQQAYPCGNGQEEKDGRLAFVSGHASTATVFAFYNCGYFLWTLFYRDRRSVMSHIVAMQGKRGVFLKDLGQALAVYWCLIQICFGWGIGISRIIDNKHGPADVVGGFVLGAMIGLVFVFKAIPTAKYVVGRGPAFNMAHSFDLRHGFLDRSEEDRHPQQPGAIPQHGGHQQGHNILPIASNV